MLPRNTHIIQKQSFEIGFENPETTLGLQDQVAQVFYENLKPRMEKMFDEMFNNDQYAIIDNLEIDLGTLDPENWEQEFADRAIEKLRISLAATHNDIINAQKYHSQRAIETFFFYLENGFMPWNSRLSTTAELEKLLTVNDQFVRRLMKLIRLKGLVAERLVYQFSEAFTQRVINEIIPAKQEKMHEVFELLQEFDPFSAPPQTGQQFSKGITDIALLQVLASAHEFTTEKYFRTLLILVHRDHILEIRINKILNAIKTRNFQNANTAKAIEEKSFFGEHKQKSEKEQLQPDETLQMEIPASVKTSVGDIYIENAGLVLLHPFLMSLFENLGLTKNEKWHDDFCQQKAVLILQYLAKGISPADEHELVLNKIMCGLQPEDVINTASELEVDTMTECENLLAAVIKHWSILRNTSVESLRETFLQRSAKLSMIDQGWLLQVEQKSFDVLLNNLPWGIGIVKIPVMNEMLFVEWA
jgi:hypothetical protein